MSTPFLGLDHVVVPVRDATASHRFYADVLGLPLVDAMSGDDWGGRPWLMMMFGLGDGRQLVLVTLQGAAPARERGLPSETRHVAMSVASRTELSTWKRRLALYSVETKEEDHGLQRSLYFADPDGLVLEITTPPTPTSAQPSPGAATVVEAWLASQRTASRRQRRRAAAAPAKRPMRGRKRSSSK
jgi:catechol 2,3-dioxygenase-like lactoylglutathione lyase family enzyme